MAQDRILGEQVDVVDLSADIANDPTAIDNIATGVANDPTAIASLEAGVDHDNIINGSGTNSHTQIDSHIADGTLHFTQAAISITASQVSDFSTASATEIAAASIDDLSDVSVVGATTGQLLTYNNSPAGWVAQDVPINDVTNPMTSNLDTGGFNIVTLATGTIGSPPQTQTSDSIVIRTGNANNAGYGYAGNIQIVTGAGTVGNYTYGGYLLLRAGNSGEAETTFNVAENGDVFIYGGRETYSYGGKYGGKFRWLAGDGINGNYGGYVKLYAGDSASPDGSGAGGSFQIQSGSGNGTQGGPMRIYAGSGTDTFSSGTFTIRGGHQSGTLKPSLVRIIGGGSGTANDGGDVEITGGTPAPANGTVGGDIKLIPGGSTYANSSGGSIQVHAGKDKAEQGSIQIWNDTNIGHTTGGYIELKVSAAITGTGSPLNNLTLTLPSTDGLTGQALQSDGSGNLSFSGPRLLEGTGTPEGSVAAPQGSLYTDDAGGTGTTLYIKETSTNTTGWIAVARGIANVVEDTTPQLGGDLDVNSFTIKTLDNLGGANVDDILLTTGNATTNNAGDFSVITGDATYGIAGNIILTAGNVSGPFGGDPGNVTITSGAANNTGTPSGYGASGNINLKGANSTGDNGAGHINIDGGDAVGVNSPNSAYAYGGDVNITSGTASQTDKGRAGQITMICGSSPATGAAGGEIWLTGGQSTGAGGRAGELRFWAGDATGLGAEGGDIALIAGDATNVTTGTGGTIEIRSGASNGSISQGSDINILGGTATNNNVPTSSTGRVYIRGGASYGGTKLGAKVTVVGGSSNAAIAGTVEILGGACSTTYAGGDVNIHPGKSTSGTDGNISLHPAQGSSGAAAIRLWNHETTLLTSGNYIELTAPTFAGSPPANITFVLPELDGANGDVLVTDGTGNLSFATATETTVITTAVDWSISNNLHASPSGATSFVFTAPAGASTLILKLTNGSGNTPTWPATVKFPGSTEPTWSTGDDIITFYYDGTSYNTINTALNLQILP